MERFLDDLLFQSPSLRGSGRFVGRPRYLLRNWKLVSIPFIAGQWSLRRGRRDCRIAYQRVSIPFIAGQWSLRGAGGRSRPLVPPCFNPLHCGAVVASPPYDEPMASSALVSIPFIAGQWSLRLPDGHIPVPDWCFNPLHCGAVVASVWYGVTPLKSTCFNPLHCGAVVASGEEDADGEE